MYPALSPHTPAALVRTLAVTALALLLGGLLSIAGCNGDGGTPADSTTATTSTTTPSSTVATPTTVATGSTTPTSPSSRTTVTYAGPTTTEAGAPVMSSALAESNALARELKTTLMIVNELIAAHEEAGSPPDDPRIATIFALRAQGQALTARRAIVDGQLPLADEAVRQCQKLLLRAVPQDDATATAVAQAKAILGQMPAPSQEPAEAASYLDEIIQTLRPLVPSSDAG